MENFIVGALIGIIIAVIIVIILRYTAFKDRDMKYLYLAIILVFAISGGFIQNSYFTVSADAMPSPQEQIDSITADIEDGWDNTNGGFDIDQIKKAQEDDDTPYFDDQIIDLTCHDFGSYIVFSYKDGAKHQNAMFYKSDNGLILDGLINVNVSMTGINWFYKYDFDSFKWVDKRNKEPQYIQTHVPIDWDVINGKYDNLLSVSRQSTDFLQYNYKFRTNKSEMTNYVMKNIANLTSQNITSHFIKFNDVELIGTAKTGFIKINSFYNYLYEQIKGTQYNTSKLIDCTPSMCLPIPKAMQINYPIAVSKQPDYNGAEYYGVYKTNIGVNLKFSSGNKTINSTVKNEDYIDTLEKDEDYKDKINVEDIEPNYSFTKVELGFKDTRQSDLSTTNLLTSPIKIILNCESLDIEKVVTIDSVVKLKSGIDVLLNSNETWNFYIDSKELIFEDFKGSFSIKTNSSEIDFDYYYLNNYTVASIGLNPIGTIDTSLIDLQTNPVKIVLSNDTKTYQFVFDRNDQLNMQQSELVEMGEYNYTILSNQLLFASVTGKLTITSTDKTMLFNYAINVQEDALLFDITIDDIGTTPNTFRLHSDASNVALIRETLSSQKVYTVTCVIYDEDGRLMESFDHTHAVSGTCSDTWRSTNLIQGKQYTLQLRFADRDDVTVTYLSDIATFVFENNTTYQISYTATKN